MLARSLYRCACGLHNGHLAGLVPQHVDRVLLPLEANFGNLPFVSNLLILEYLRISNVNHEEAYCRHLQDHVILSHHAKLTQSLNIKSS